MSSNYSNEFHLPIDYYTMNCSSRVSPRRLKINRFQQQISCPSQQISSPQQQVSSPTQVSPTPRPSQIAQQVSSPTQVSPTPRPTQIAQQVSSPTQVSSSGQVQAQVPPQISPQTEQFISGQASPFSPLVGQVDPGTSFSLLEAFAKVIEDANEKGILSNEDARLRFEQILTIEGDRFIKILEEQVARLHRKKSN